MSKFTVTAALLFGVAVLCAAGTASATLIISATNTPSTIDFDAEVAEVFSPGAGINAGGAATGVGETTQFNFFGVFNDDRSGGLHTEGAAMSHQFHTIASVQGRATTFGSDSNGDTDTNDIVGSNQLGAERAADLAGHTSNGLLLSKEGDFARSGFYLRIQNNTGATVTDWNFAADVFYEETDNNVASTATFGYAIDNGTDPTFFDGTNPLITSGMTYTGFGSAPAAAFGDTYATSAYSLDETVITAGVADGDYIVLGFFDQLNNANGSGIVIDDISVTAVSAIPEPSSFVFLCCAAFLALCKRRRS